MCTTHAVQTSLQIKLNTPCQKVCRNDEGAGEGCVKGERGGEGERGREVFLNKYPVRLIAFFFLQTMVVLFGYERATLALGCLQSNFAYETFGWCTDEERKTGTIIAVTKIM